MEEAARFATSMNIGVSDSIGINHAARVTCVKPSGTTSCVLGCSSGIHAWHNDYYLRTIRFGKSEEIARYMQEKHPELCEDDILRPHDTLCVRFPIKAPEGSIFTTESALDTLERVKKFSQQWIKPGHNNGENTHNVSATIYIDKNKTYMYPLDKFVHEVEYWDEWKEVGNWMWENREVYNGLSVLPKDGGSYKQTPFENITKEEYERRIEFIHDFEHDDNVQFGQVAACSGSQCEINV